MLGLAQKAQRTSGYGYQQDPVGHRRCPQRQRRDARELYRRSADPRGVRPKRGPTPGVCRPRLYLLEHHSAPSSVQIRPKRRAPQ
jgi:hypothetical protein